jgi:hypothetical protein
MQGRARIRRAFWQWRIEVFSKDGRLDHIVVLILVKVFVSNVLDLFSEQFVRKDLSYRILNDNVDAVGILGKNALEIILPKNVGTQKCHNLFIIAMKLVKDGVQHRRDAAWSVVVRPVNSQHGGPRADGNQGGIVKVIPLTIV